MRNENSDQLILLNTHIITPKGLPFLINNNILIEYYLQFNKVLTKKCIR